MSEVAYCRVKWTVGGLTEHKIEDYNGRTCTDYITIVLGNKYLDEWQVFRAF